MVVLDREHPEHLVAARSGSPLVIGLGIGENFLASDQLALLKRNSSFHLFRGRRYRRNHTSYRGYLRCQWSKSVEREVHESNLENDAAEKANSAISCKRNL